MQRNPKEPKKTLKKELLEKRETGEMSLLELPQASPRAKKVLSNYLKTE